MTVYQRSNSADGRERRLAIALLREPADTVVRECRVLDVNTGLFENGGIAIAGERIAYVGAVEDLIGPETKIIEGRGRIAVPGLIDGHIHTYEMLLPPSEVARGLFRHGVTTVVTDFYGEAVVRGTDAVNATLAEAAGTRMNFVYLLPMPALYQDRPFAHTGTIDLDRMKEMADWQTCHGLNECFAKDLLSGEPELRELVNIVSERGGKICGHGSEASEKEVQAWSGWVGRLDDHEAASGEEALTRLRAGIHVIAREGTGVSNLSPIIRRLLDEGVNFRRVSLCTDVLSPVDLLLRGSIDYNVRRCMELGVPPVTAVQMATLNSAECHQIDHDVGSIAAGRRADIILLEGKLEDFEIATVLAAGVVVSSGGANTEERKIPERPSFAYGTVQTGRVTPELFQIAAPTGAKSILARVIGVDVGTVITRELHRSLEVRNGFVRPDLEHGVNLIAAIERHTGFGTIGRGFVEGLGLRSGAFATTFAPQSQHLVVAGACEEDMAVVVEECVRLGGGFVVANAGKIVASVPFPLYGLLSEEPIDVLVEQIEAAIAALQALGCTLPAPFHTLAFTSLPVSIGTLKVSSVGLVDVWLGKAVSLEVE